MEKTRPERCKCLKMCCRVHIKWAWTELKGSCEKFFWLELSKKKNETKHFQFLTVVILSFSYFQLNVYLKWFTSLWCWIVANLCTTLNKSIVKYVHSEEIAVTRVKDQEFFGDWHLKTCPIYLLQVDSSAVLLCIWWTP